MPKSELRDMIMGSLSRAEKEREESKEAEAQKRAEARAKREAEDAERRRLLDPEYYVDNVLLAKGNLRSSITFQEGIDAMLNEADGDKEKRKTDIEGVFIGLFVRQDAVLNDVLHGWDPMNGEPFTFDRIQNVQDIEAIVLIPFDNLYNTKGMAINWLSLAIDKGVRKEGRVYKHRFMLLKGHGQDGEISNKVSAGWLSIAEIYASEKEEVRLGSCRTREDAIAYVRQNLGHHFRF